MFRDHVKYRPNPQLVVRHQSIQSESLVCSVTLCQRRHSNLWELTQHIKEHIDVGVTMPCPFGNCCYKFKNKSSFTSHLSRKHRNCVIKSQTPINCDINPRYIQLKAAAADSDDETEVVDIRDLISIADHEVHQQHTLPSNSMNKLCKDFDDQFVNNVALLYLKLQGKYLLPNSTIQVIVDEMANIHNLNFEAMKSHLNKNLVELDLPQNVVANIVNDLRAKDLFSQVHDARSGVLRSQHTRFKFFKERFNFVSPVQINLGRNAANVPRVCHYVPIKQSLSALLNNPCVRFQLSNPPTSRTNILSDLKDGKAYKSNIFFANNSNAVQLILFQDAFELVNPLGSARKKHKILGVYYTIGNIHVQYRSSVAQLQLVLLCREVDLKYFGSTIVFRRMLQDLQDLEKNGLSMPYGNIRGTVAAITGDNLGSHGIGGFTENFSTAKYICRYCDCSRSEWTSDGTAQGCFRTVDSYNAAIETLTNDPACA